jgi:hypothetical protein
MRRNQETPRNDQVPPSTGDRLRPMPPPEGEWVAGQRGSQPASAPDQAGLTAAVPEQPGPPDVAATRAGPGAAPGDLGANAGAPLVTDQDRLRQSWLRIQSGFVDDPRGSVTEAASLVAEITGTLATAVQDRERRLRGAWDGNSDADTEILRNALRDYRTFFELLIRL